jgi:hypothetical protein
MTAGIDDVERSSAFNVWLFSGFNRDPKSNLAAVDLLSLDSTDRFADLGCGSSLAHHSRPTQSL